MNIQEKTYSQFETLITISSKTNEHIRKIVPLWSLSKTLLLSWTMWIVTKFYIGGISIPKLNYMPVWYNGNPTNFHCADLSFTLYLLSLNDF